jgi:hypothetical protein
MLILMLSLLFLFPFFCAGGGCTGVRPSGNVIIQGRLETDLCASGELERRDDVNGQGALPIAQ